MTSVSLRPYQHQAVQALRAEVAQGHRRIVLVSPTGSGKTTIAGHILRSAMARGHHCLFLAHRKELIDQAYSRVLHMGVDPSQVGVIMSGDPRYRPFVQLQVASIDTLRNRPKPEAQLVIVDECHRSLAKSYRDILDHYHNAVVIGLTATPYRADGKGLGDIYEGLVLVAQPRELIDDGFLVAPKILSAPLDQLPDLSDVRRSRGDYDSKALAQAVDKNALVGNIVEQWNKHAEGRRSIVFATSVAHSRHIIERFCARGVRAEHIDGEMSRLDREAVFENLRTGVTQVVSNVGIATEGFDLPSLKVAVLARPTKSKGLYLQMAGRVMRPFDGQEALVLDHAGCVFEHGFPQDDQEYDLDPTPKKKGAGEAPVKVCPGCDAVLATAVRTCPHCGHAFPFAERDTESDVDLIEVTPKMVPLKAFALDPVHDEPAFQRLKAIAQAHGHSEAWLARRYEREVGGALPHEWRARIYEAQSEREMLDAYRQGLPSDGWARTAALVGMGPRAFRARQAKSLS